MIYCARLPIIHFQQVVSIYVPYRDGMAHIQNLLFYVGYEIPEKGSSTTDTEEQAG
jgi:hypothetical protein